MMRDKTNIISTKLSWFIDACEQVVFLLLLRGRGSVLGIRNILALQSGWEIPPLPLNFKTCLYG